MDDPSEVSAVFAARGVQAILAPDYEMGKLRLYDEMVARFAPALNVRADEILVLKNRQKDGPKHCLKIMRRMKALEGLPPNKQRTILDSLDLMIQSASDNRRDS